MYGFIHAWFALPTVLEQIRVVDRLPRRAVAQFRERDTGRVVPDDTLGLALWAPHHRPQLVDLGDRLLRGRWEGQIANGRRELLGLADHLGPVSSANDTTIPPHIEDHRSHVEEAERVGLDARPDEFALDGVTLPFLGQPVTLVLDPRQQHGRGGAVLAEGDGAGVLHIGLPHTATPEQLRDVAQAWLMRQARRVFIARLDHFAPQLDVRWQKLSLSSAGTRWGSASADGSIRLNWRLIHFREPIIDYVVVHELAHLREMNHSPRFWQHVENVLPDYAERRGALKDEAVPRW